MNDGRNSHLTTAVQAGKTHSKASAYAGKMNLAAVLLFVIVCALWYFAAHIVGRPFVFPYIENVAGEIAYALTDLAVLRAIVITIRRILIGTLYATLIGVPIGMAMGFSKLMMKMLAPYVNALRQIPTTAWVPLAIIWFGLGEGPTLFVLTLHGVFIIILNTAAGVMDIDREYYNAVRSMGANRLDIIRDVVLPGSMPGIITGVRLALGLGWMTVV